MTRHNQPILIGEVLYDLFENGQAILGGAPFNVAWHLQGFGLSPMFISRVGDDTNGMKIIETMRIWGMDTSGIQIDSERPTGTVDIKLNNGQAVFDISDDVAYDYIEPNLFDNVLSDMSRSLLYHGSLVARHEQVFQALLQMRQDSRSNFLDINLRSPWWEKHKLNKLMQGTNWLKVNDDELAILTGAENSLSALIDSAKAMQAEYAIDTIILTRGAQGACIIQDDSYLEAKPVKVTDIRDTVGAGDAFSSVCILGLLDNWETDTMLNRATDFAARICQQDGATQADQNLYDDLRNKWQLSE